MNLDIPCTPCCCLITSGLWLINLEKLSLLDMSKTKRLQLFVNQMLPNSMQQGKTLHQHKADSIRGLLNIPCL